MSCLWLRQVLSLLWPPFTWDKNEKIQWFITMEGTSPGRFWKWGRGCDIFVFYSNWRLLLTFGDQHPGIVTLLSYLGWSPQQWNYFIQHINSAPIRKHWMISIGLDKFHHLTTNWCLSGVFFPKGWMITVALQRPALLKEKYIFLQQISAIPRLLHAKNARSAARVGRSSASWVPLHLSVHHLIWL